MSRPILDCDNGVFFGAFGWGPRSRASLAPTRPHTPHPLPAERCKRTAQEGGGGQYRPATVLSHTVGLECSTFPPFRKGKCCPFF